MGNEAGANPGGKGEMSQSPSPRKALEEKKASSAQDIPASCPVSVYLLTHLFCRSSDTIWALRITNYVRKLSGGTLSLGGDCIPFVGHLQLLKLCIIMSV